MNPSNFITIYCNKCSKEFCSKNPLVQLKQHLRWCNKKYEFLEQFSLSKEKIQNEYDLLGSVLEFKNKYPFWDNFTHYYRLFKELDIDYSLKKSLEKQTTKDKRTKTHFERYGIEHNFKKEAKSRKKWEKRLFEKEGITNVFQREDVKNKSIETFLNKYSTELWKHSLTVRGSGIISKLNRVVFELLDNLKIDYSIEYKLNAKSIGKNYFSYDILLNNSKKIIEVNGDYWHGNPLIYKETDIILKGSSQEILVTDKWKKDKIKIDFAINQGYDVLILWENEFKNGEQYIIDKIKNFKEKI